MACNIDERITDEIAALEAILLGDLIIHGRNSMPTTIQAVLHPLTGANTNQQYVCLTLEVHLTDGYPDISPKVNLRNPRGLDDSVLDTINAQIEDKLIDCLGQPVVFELIEIVRENLTNSNLPSGQCVICLYGFMSGDVFIKTPCYHHFHSHCLSSHLVASKKNYNEEFDKLPPWQKKQASPYQPTCPVCREPINCDANALGEAPPPKELSAARNFELTSELKALQEKMAELYQRQQSRGGIIDIEADQSKLLLLTGDNGGSSSTDAPSSSSPSDELPIDDITNSASADSSEKIDSSSSPQGNRGAYKGPYRGFNRNRGVSNRRANQSRGRSTLNSPQSCQSATR